MAKYVKSVSLMVQKVTVILKLTTDKDRQTNGTKTICPDRSSQGHKKSVIFKGHKKLIFSKNYKLVSKLFSDLLVKN